MQSLLFCILLINPEVALTEETLPHLNKFAFAQVRKEKVLLVVAEGSKGKAYLIDLAEATIRSIDSAKTPFFFPYPLLHQGKFVLFDGLLKKIIFLEDDGSVSQATHFRDIAPWLAQQRILAASIYSDTEWLLTLEDQARKTVRVETFKPASGDLSPLFKAEASEERKWYWLDERLIRITSRTGEIAMIDPATGRRLKLLRPAQTLITPKKKPRWMRKLKPYDRLRQVVFGVQTSISMHHFEDDDPEQGILMALTLKDGTFVPTPRSLLAAHKGRRLLFDWGENALVLEEASL